MPSKHILGLVKMFASNADKWVVPADKHQLKGQLAKKFKGREEELRFKEKPTSRRANNRAKSTRVQDSGLGQSLTRCN